MTHTGKSRTRSTRTLPLALALIFSLSLGWFALPASLQRYFVPAASAAGATFIVTNVNNSGAGSLRQAILDANAAPGLDTIKFAIGAGPVFIKPTSALPAITSPVVIDGTTQPGYNGQPIVQLDGTLAGVGTDGLFISAGGSTVRALAINRFSGNGIRLEVGGGNKIKGCHIGNVAYAGNGQNGVSILSSSQNSIGGDVFGDRNVISGNGINGVQISGGAANSITGNYIGTDAEGHGDFGNGHSGVFIGGNSNSNNVGSTAPGAHNIISGNDQAGISLQNAGPGNVILGNNIGTDAERVNAIPNAKGIHLLQSPGNSIGNGKSEGSNVISGNSGSGILVDSSSGTVIKGNYIGTNYGGHKGIGNGGAGLSINASGNCTVGGAGAERNIIAGNKGDGIKIADSPAPGNKIQGNQIGKSDPSNTLGNGGHGISIINSSGNLVGDESTDYTKAPLTNIITRNGGAGVYIQGKSSGNAIRINSIHSNGGLGIDLTSNGVTGVTPNDFGDSDSGPNGLQNFPVLNNALTDGNVTTVTGTIDGLAPNTKYSMQFFSASTCDASGYGEGDKIIHSSQGTALGGQSGFSAFIEPVPAGTFVISTLTGPDGTSEFSKCVAVLNKVDLEVKMGVTPNAPSPGQPVTYTVSVKNQGPSAMVDTSFHVEVQLHDAISFNSCSPSTGAGCYLSEGKVRFVNFKLGVGETATATIQAQVKPGASGKLTSAACLTSFTPLDVDTNAANDCATAEVSVTPSDSVQFGNSSSLIIQESAKVVQIPVTRTGSTSGAATVYYETIDGEAPDVAKALTDYVASSGTLSFAPGETSKLISVEIKEDLLLEKEENFKITLSAPTGTTIGNPSTFTVVIEDSAPPQPSVSVKGSTVAEGNDGKTDAQFTITLSNVSSKKVTVDYVTTDVTAAAGADYQPASGTLTFEPGETQKAVSVSINNDNINELDETFSLGLSNAVNATISTNSATVIILNDDAPTVELGNSAYTINENAVNTVQGFGSLTVEVKRKGDTSNSATVQYYTSDQSGGNDCDQATGFASQRCDYAAVAGTLRFAPGESTKQIQISFVNDGYMEGPETLKISLQNPSVGTALGMVSEATVTIEDRGVITTAAENLYLNNEFFVRQNYLDFLGREPDSEGWNTWPGVLNNCGPEKGFLGAPRNCDRAHVAHGFIASAEFTTRGYNIYRMYEAALLRLPRYAEFVPDMAAMSGAPNSQELEQNTQQFAESFTARAEFTARYGDISAPAQAELFIARLEQNAGVGLPALTTTLPGQPPQYNRQDLINKRLSGEFTLGQTLRAFVEQKVIYDRYFERGFVTMQYFGFLRRDPDLNDPNLTGWTEWVFVFTNGGAQRGRADILPRDYHHLTFGFIYSEEYRKRFGQP